MEDNLIREKLEGLHALPENYRPNLDSKWDLLEASLKGRSRSRQRLFRWVAALTGVFLLGSLFLPYAGSTSLKQSITQPKAMHKFKTKGTVPSPETSDLAATTPEPPRTFVQKKADPGPVIPEHVVPSSGDIKDSLLFTQASSSPALSAEESPGLKKKKNRYVQLDFSDPVQQAAVSATQQPLYARGFRVGIFNNNGLSPTNTHTGSPGALFKINF